MLTSRRLRTIVLTLPTSRRWGSIALVLTLLTSRRLMFLLTCCSRDMSGVVDYDFNFGWGLLGRFLWSVMPLLSSGTESAKTAFPDNIHTTMSGTLANNTQLCVSTILLSVIAFCTLVKCAKETTLYMRVVATLTVTSTILAIWGL